MRWALLLLLLLFPAGGQGDGCAPYGCAGGDDASWIVVVGDTQIRNWQSAVTEIDTGMANYNQDIMGFIHDNRDRISMVMFTGDQIGGSYGSDGLAEPDCDTGTDPDMNLATADSGERYAAWVTAFYNPLVEMEIPFVAAQGNHDPWEEHKDLFDADWVTAMEALPHVVDAAYHPDGDMHYVVVDNYLGGQLIAFGASEKNYNDDTPICGGCPGGGAGCLGIDWWADVGGGSHDEWFDAAMAAYPTAWGAHVIHTSVGYSVASKIKEQGRFILNAEAHVQFSVDKTHIDSTGTYPILFINHNAQWWGPSGRREAQVVRFDPQRQQVTVDLVETSALWVRDFVQCPSGVCEPGSATLPYGLIPDTGQLAQPPTYHKPLVPDGRRGWLSSPGCLFAYFVGDITNRNNCLSPSGGADLWYDWTGDPGGVSNVRNGLEAVPAPLGFPRSAFFPYRNAFRVGVGDGSEPLETRLGLRLRDTDGGGATPEELAVDNLLMCHWLKPKYGTIGQFDAMVSAGYTEEWAYFIHWGAEIWSYFHTNDTGDRWTYHAGDAESEFVGYGITDDDWYHECWAWGKDAYGAGGTAGTVELWRDGAKVTADNEVVSTNVIIDAGVVVEVPDGTGSVSGGDEEGFEGGYGEWAFFDISDLDFSEAQLGQMVNHIRLCGLGDNVFSDTIAVRYGGTANVLGPNGETACTR